MPDHAWSQSRCLMLNPVIDPQITASRITIPPHHHHRFPSPSPTLASAPNPTLTSPQKPTLASMQNPTPTQYYHVYDRPHRHRQRSPCRSPTQSSMLKHTPKGTPQ